MTTTVTTVLFVTLAAATSLPAFTKHASAPVVLMIGHAMAQSVILAAKGTLVRFVDRSPGLAVPVCAALCLVLASANGLLYPGTRTTPARSSAPDAMIEPATRAFQGIHPYADVLFDGAPISPGPGWIALHAPLTMTGGIGLLVPVHLMLAASMLARYQRAASVCFVILMVALPAFMQMSFVGHDLFAVGCAMLTVTLGTYLDASRGTWRLIGWSVAAGIVASARAPLVVFVGALGLLIGRRDLGAGSKFLGFAGLTLLGIHLIVFWWGHSLGLAYQPFHVFSRAERAGSLVVLIGIALCTGLAIWQWRRSTQAIADWLTFVWTIAGLPFAVVGIGELLGPTGMDWANWEGKGYAAFALPLLVGAVLLARNERATPANRRSRETRPRTSSAARRWFSQSND